jgi:hypothetical protein
LICRTYQYDAGECQPSGATVIICPLFNHLTDYGFVFVEALDKELTLCERVTILCYRHEQDTDPFDYQTLRLKHQ